MTSEGRHDSSITFFELRAERHKLIRTEPFKEKKICLTFLSFPLTGHF